MFCIPIVYAESRPAPQIDEYTTTGKLAVLDPANQAAEQAANAKEAEQKATGDAFAFL